MKYNAEYRIYGRITLDIAAESSMDGQKRADKEVENANLGDVDLDYINVTSSVMVAPNVCRVKADIFGYYEVDFEAKNDKDALRIAEDDAYPTNKNMGIIEGMDAELLSVNKDGSVVYHLSDRGEIEYDD